MDKDKLFERYYKFTKFEKEDIEKRLLELPSITAFYQQVFFTLSEKANKAQFDLDEKWQEKYLYYKNEYNIALNNNEIKNFIEKDLEYIKLKKVLTHYEILASQVEEVLKALDSMRWTLKSLIDWYKFQAGIFH